MSPLQDGLGRMFSICSTCHHSFDPDEDFLPIVFARKQSSKNVQFEITEN
jgi:hypothetical protein